VTFRRLKPPLLIFGLAAVEDLQLQPPLLIFGLAAAPDLPRYPFRGIEGDCLIGWPIHTLVVNAVRSCVAHSAPQIIVG